MNKLFSTLAISLAVLSLTACDTTQSNDNDGTSASSVSSVQETRNVLYRGTVRTSGASIFMQGTHRLELDDGRFVLLESDAVDLDDYLNERVEVYGSVRPTVEAGGMIMRVESVASLETSSEASSSEESSASSESSSSVSSAISSTVSNSSRVASSVPASSSVAAVSSSASSVDEGGSSADVDAKAAIMARDDLSAPNWTQQYCSSHIKFCIPVHRNWWYTSFGATASSLWHMEIGPEELESIGDGVITVKLVSGSVASAGASDRQVSVNGGMAIGYRTWEGDRHFEIRGPASLEQAVRYITEQLQQTAG